MTSSMSSGSIQPPTRPVILALGMNPSVSRCCDHVDRTKSMTAASQRCISVQPSLPGSISIWSKYSSLRV